MRLLVYGLAALALTIAPPLNAAQESAPRLQEYPVPAGLHPHDVAPAPDGTVWYTAQRIGELGRLDPATGQIRRIKLGEKSRPHGVIVGPDGAPWIRYGSGKHMKDSVRYRQSLDEQAPNAPRTNLPYEK